LPELNPEGQARPTPDSEAAPGSSAPADAEAASAGESGAGLPIDAALAPAVNGDGSAPIRAIQAPPPTDSQVAASLSSAVEQLGTLLEAGGPVIAILGLLSVFALTVALVKLWQFAQLRIGDNGPVAKALRCWYQGAPEAALDAVADRPQPVAQVVRIAIAGLHRGVDPALLREELVRVAGAKLEQLRSWLRALEVIGTLSPLLGLLGTVLGMIAAFRQLEAAGSQVDPSLLSGGIWQALLTTAVGLAVAIPVVLMHSWLERRVERCGHAMEDAMTQVFTCAGGLPPDPFPLDATEGAAGGGVAARFSRPPTAPAHAA